MAAGVEGVAGVGVVVGAVVGVVMGMAMGGEATSDADAGTGGVMVDKFEVTEFGIA